jgi:L-asparagine oxygenase
VALSGSVLSKDVNTGVGEVPDEDFVFLEAAESIALRQAFQALAAKYRNLPLDTAELFMDAEATLRKASADLTRRLVGFRVAGSASGGLLVRGLPVDGPLPATPADGRYGGPWRNLGVSALTQLAVMGLLGGVISYADEKNGDIIQDVCPVPGAEYRQENTGSHILELHTEDGFHPGMPHFISLFCLRQDHLRSALTLLVGIRRMLPELSDDVIAQLRRPAYRIRLSSSFVGEGAVSYSAPIAVLTGPRDDPDMCVDFHGMEAMDEPGAKALDILRVVAERSLVGVALEPGDLLVVDNRLAAHGRTGFQPRYDGADRWLRRCFAVSDLRASRQLRYPASRIHRPLRFPATTTGC